jgi:hypothetical protein
MLNTHHEARGDAEVNPLDDGIDPIFRQKYVVIIANHSAGALTSTLSFFGFLSMSSSGTVTSVASISIL